MSSIRNDLNIHHFIQKLTGDSDNITVFKGNSFTSFWSAPIGFSSQKVTKVSLAPPLVESGQNTIF